MKTLGAVLLLCSFSANILCQDNKSQFSYGINFNPHISDRAYLNIPPEYKDVKSLYSNRIKLGWTTGIFFQRQLAQKSSLEFGLNFSNKGSAMHEKWFFEDSIRDLFIAEEGKYAEEWTIIGSHYHIDLPISVNYSFYKNLAWDFYTRLGLVPNFYIAAKSHSKTNYSDGSKLLKNESYTYQQMKTELNLLVHRFNISGLLAVGTVYDINERFGIIVESIFDMNILPRYYKNEILIDYGTERFYNVGIRFGLIVH